MRRALVAILVALMCMAGPVGGQSTFGSIVGAVHDASEGVIAGASIQIRSLEDNSVRSTTAGTDGSFEFVNLKPGKYALSTQAAGFAEFQVPSAELNARQTLRIDVTMTVETQVQKIEVSESVAVINTENGIIGDSKATAQIGQMPTNYRAVSTSPLGALTISPNVQQDSQGNLALGGATSNMVGFSVDGISTANIVANGALPDPYPSSEGIAELKVTAFNNGAEFAQVGDITFTTKSGTNRFHGSLFEYLQNDVLDATVLNFNVKAPKRFNTFGGSLGGPVAIPKLYDGKDKTFFFFDYEGNRRRTSTPEQFLVPTLAQRSGNLSDLPIPNNTLIDPKNGRAFPNNQIPALRINPAAQALLGNYYPLPNINSPGSSFNYETLAPVPSNTNGFDLRLDQALGSKQQVYARFSWKNVLANVANPLLPNDVDQEHNRSFLVSHNYVISPRLINEFRFGFTHTVIGVNFGIQGAKALSQLGLTGVDVSQHHAAGAFSSFNFADGTGFTPLGRDKTGVTRSETNQFTDNLTYTLGKHTMRYGLDVRRVRYFSPATFTASDDFGLFTFNQGVFTGSSFGDFLLGAPNTAYFAVTAPDIDARSTQYGIYGQDVWQVNDRLTMTFGLRWTVLPAFTERIGDLGNFDPRTNSVIVPDRLIQAVGTDGGLLRQ